LKIFVCEFISCGGLYREPLPGGLLAEGLRMRNALLQDLRELENIELLSSHDYRLSSPDVDLSAMVAPDDDVWQVWTGLIDQADAVWLIAPESAGMLLKLSELVTARGKLLFGCPPSAVRPAASKLETCSILSAAGIPCVPTWSARIWLEQYRDSKAQGWVAKPDDGVGCEDTVHLRDADAMNAWLRQGRESTHVVQPMRDGVACSLSMLCRNGIAWLLSCNRQLVDSDAGRFVYQGSVINGMLKCWTEFEMLARDIAQASPELTGYVGVDLMVMADGNRLLLEVLEINPRLTTSYVGLRQATGVNVATQTLRLMTVQNANHFELPEIARNVVEITL
jgi:predicted ATP-grasp superfamily ATP-dependent carboligase